jgi:hypothetical protein
MLVIDMVHSIVASIGMEEGVVGTAVGPVIPSCTGMRWNLLEMGRVTEASTGKNKGGNM